MEMSRKTREITPFLSMSGKLWGSNRTLGYDRIEKNGNSKLFL